MSAKNVNCNLSQHGGNTISQLKYFIFFILILSVQPATAQKIGLPVASFADSSSLKLTGNKQGNNYYTFFEVEMKAGNGILVEMESSDFRTGINFMVNDSLFGEPETWKVFSINCAAVSYVAKKDLILTVFLFSADENTAGHFRYRYKLFNPQMLAIEKMATDKMRLYSLIQHWLLNWRFVPSKSPIPADAFSEGGYNFTTRSHTYKKNNNAEVKIAYKEILFSQNDYAKAKSVKDYYYKTKKIVETYFDTSYWKIEFRGEQKFTGSNDFSGKKAFSDYIISSLVITLRNEFADGFFYPGKKAAYNLPDITLQLLVYTEPKQKGYAAPAVKLLLQ